MDLPSSKLGRQNVVAIATSIILYETEEKACPNNSASINRHFVFFLSLENKNEQGTIFVIPILFYVHFNSDHSLPPFCCIINRCHFLFRSPLLLLLLILKYIIIIIFLKKYNKRKKERKKERRKKERKKESKKESKQRNKEKERRKKERRRFKNCFFLIDDK
jgi:predicted membrane protein